MRATSLTRPSSLPVEAVLPCACLKARSNSLKRWYSGVVSATFRRCKNGPSLAFRSCRVRGGAATAPLPGLFRPFSLASGAGVTSRCGGRAAADIKLPVKSAAVPALPLPAPLPTPPAGCVEVPVPSTAPRVGGFCRWFAFLRRRSRSKAAGSCSFTKPSPEPSDEPPPRSSVNRRCTPLLPTIPNADTTWLSGAPPAARAASATPNRAYAPLKNAASPAAAAPSNRHTWQVGWAQRNQSAHAQHAPKPLQTVQ